MTEKPKIIIYVGSQRDGYTFRLTATSRLWLEENHPDRERVPSVFIGFDRRQDLQQVHDSVKNQVWQLLTGLSADEIARIGGLVVINPMTKEEFYSLVPAYV